MKTLKRFLALLALAACTCSVPTAQALAAPTPVPAWDIQALAAPTNFKPGDASGLATYEAFLVNNGAKVTDQSQITIVDVLPEGLGVKSVKLQTPRRSGAVIENPSACEAQTVAEVTTLICKVTNALLPEVEPAKLFPGEMLRLAIKVTVPPSLEGPLTNKVSVEGGGAQAAQAESKNQASNEEKSPAGFQEFHAELSGADGEPTTGADSHPYQYTTSFAVNTEPSPPGSLQPLQPAEGDLKEVEVTLPPGLVGNPTAVKTCTVQQFNSLHGTNSLYLKEDVYPNECPTGSAVGLAMVQQFEGVGAQIRAPIYNLVPPKGMPAQLGFQVGGLPIYINTRLRSDGDYGITAYLSNTPQAKRITAVRTTIWGVPAHPSHDPMRGSCALLGANCPEPEEAPFMRLPSSCAQQMTTAIGFDTWLHPGTLIEAAFTEAAPVDCELPDFSPEIEAEPTTNVADAPSGLHFNLHLPQTANEDPEGLGEADLKDTTVTLPEGLLVNPSSANGLDGCSPAEVGLTTPVGQGDAHFSAASPHCPDASKLGSVTLKTPLLDHPLPGAVYLSDPHQNPFNSLLAIYIAVDDPQTGVVAKLAGKVEADPATGQLTTTVKASPQVPFEDFELDFFEGARAPLRTPATCGTHTTTSSLRPWTAPAFGPNATPSDSFQITSAPAGASGCPTSPGAQPNSPTFTAGTAAPLAGAYSPFSLRLARSDGAQELKSIDVTLPPGLTGRLAGLSYCSDGALASAATKSGRAEQASSSCPSSSELGTVTVAAGAGPAPYHAQGKAYLAGPYKGGPISMAVITPAVAGPFDLGTVVVRTALQVDPETARIRAVSDPIPAILEGIPLDVRSIDLRVERPDFTLNPTNCDPLAFSGAALSVLGQSAALNQRFQVGGCQDLAFKPKLSLRLKGGTKRGDNPAFTASLKMPPSGANIAQAQVALPRSIFLDQSHIKTICTRVQFAADACPKGAVYGSAKAWTPLLDQPLEGPVYLRSSNHKLPDLIADLNGQIHVVLHGRTDSIKGGLRNTFEGVPDAPASKFVLSLKGGKRGLLVNSRDICKGKSKATATFTAQSSKVVTLRPALGAKCGGKGKGRAQKR